MIRTAVGENRPPVPSGRPMPLASESRGRRKTPDRPGGRLRTFDRNSGDIKLQDVYKTDDRDDRVLKTEIDEIMKRVDTIMEKIQQLDPGLGQTPDPAEE
jgi:hypothetical protein